MLPRREGWPLPLPRRRLSALYAALAVAAAAVLLCHQGGALAALLRGPPTAANSRGLHGHRGRLRSPACWATGEEADGQPLEEKVRYLPSLDYSMQEELTPSGAGQGFFTLPCFPLGSTYVPETEQVLQIFEPRYRKMYSDILLSGGRRFVVPMCAQDEVGGVHLAEVGVVFYLDDLKEVSEQTNDKVKYICSHKVIGRVRLKRVLNPRAFGDRSTYLRVEVEDLIDTDAEESCSELEEQVMGLLIEVALLQEKTVAEVRFKVDLLRQQNVSRGAGFWNTVSVWQGYLGQRAQQRQKQFENEVRAKILTFLRESRGEMPAQISLDELPESVQKEVTSLQAQFQEEVEPLVRAQSAHVQVLVQSDSHRQRLNLLQTMVEKEKRRLEAQLALQSVFKSDD